MSAAPDHPRPAGPSRPPNPGHGLRLLPCGRPREESIEKLKERHEALTQTLELMAAENKERDRRIGQIMEGLARLLHIAGIHEHRLERLEGE